jgi:glycosyltransferase involved in cell wall biosynthesis
MIKDCNNWEMVPRQESLNAWMENIDYIISTSTLESFSYVVGEAMAKGIKPLIYNWEGASDIWPKELIWNDINELGKLLETNYNSPMYKQWVEDHYSVEKQYETVAKLIEGEI